jgi:hypothetical protein
MYTPRHGPGAHYAGNFRILDAQECQLFVVMLVVRTSMVQIAYVCVRGAPFAEILPRRVPDAQNAKLLLWPKPHGDQNIKT